MQKKKRSVHAVSKDLRNEHSRINESEFPPIPKATLLLLTKDQMT